MAGNVVAFGGYSSCNFEEGTVAIYADGTSVVNGQNPDVHIGGNEDFVDATAPFSSINGVAITERAAE